VRAKDSGGTFGVEKKKRAARQGAEQAPVTVTKEGGEKDRHVRSCQVKIILHEVVTPTELKS